MKKSLLIVLSLSFFSPRLSAQTFYQYFDGADTLTTSVIVNIVSDSSNVWQIGRPQKTIFDSAATLPNAIVTDTIGFIPLNNTSSFIISVHPYTLGPFVSAYQWKQKLDLLKKTWRWDSRVFC